MSDYTVVIEAGNADGTIWQAMEPAENVSEAGTAQEVAAWTAGNQNIAEGEGWRVRVWDGHDAATPAAEYAAPAIA